MVGFIIHFAEYVFRICNVIRVCSLVAWSIAQPTDMILLIYLLPDAEAMRERIEYKEILERILNRSAIVSYLARK